MSVVQFPGQRFTGGGDKMKCLGVVRDGDNPQSLTFAFSRTPTDDEMRYLHEVMERAAMIGQEPHE